MSEAAMMSLSFAPAAPATAPLRGSARGRVPRRSSSSRVPNVQASASVQTSYFPIPSVGLKLEVQSQQAYAGVAKKTPMVVMKKTRAPRKKTRVMKKRKAVKNKKLKS